jgi:alanine-glyoxylate transaminase / serine-glyoxylate transaminase / serine-pyruvate transaminase
MKGRKLLMIPGSVEFDPAVLAAMAEPTDSHTSLEFVTRMGHALDMLKEVFLAPEGQPFVVAGSGTLAMEMAAVNLAEPGDKVLVTSAGYFGARFREIFSRCGARVTYLPAPVGESPSLDVVEEELKKGGYKILVATHVDTSTAVRADVSGLAKLAQQYGVLSVIDGVAAAAGECMRQDEWGVDIYLTASQKAIGVPPGLALLVASRRALAAVAARKAPVGSYMMDFANWLPVMKAFQAHQPAYFGTPAVNLVYALEVSLGQILTEGMMARFDRHEKLARAFRAATAALGLECVARHEDNAANTLTAVFYPEGINAGLLAEVNRHGVILAAGLLAEIKDRYFRVGHMGVTGSNDLLATIGALEAGLHAQGYVFDTGAGLQAAQKVLLG